MHSGTPLFEGIREPVLCPCLFKTISGEILSDTIFFRNGEPPGIEAPSIRIQTNIMARQERNLLTWLCKHMPGAVTPDRLTAVGLIGAVIVFVGYLASNVHPGFFWLATFGIVVHWFGDSLDGSLARYRRIERSRYGYFIDHSTDAVAVLLMLVGLGLSPHIRLEMALFALLGYLLMCIFVFLFDHVTGNFQMSFLALGPTELRLIVIFLNSVMYSVGTWDVVIGRETFSAYDLFLGGCAVCLFCLYVMNVWKMAQRLRREDLPALAG